MKTDTAHAHAECLRELEELYKMSAAGEAAAAGDGDSRRERPRSAYDGSRPPKNEKWGTIMETNRGLGHQRRSKEEVDAMIERLSAVSGETRIPESQRTGALKQTGIMNSFAWKGY